mmetsp:Transcript_12200/g.31337  ORF Transcript_12200/g.31337 Transcript_12200/m.31337 type:complete len:210 (+) Transcript_12200:2734-3363(+)
MRVPEDDDMFTPLLLQDSIHQGPREVAPQIVGPDVREEDVRVHGDGEPQAVALPGDRAQVGAWDTQRPQVVAGVAVELHHAHLAVVARAALRLHAADGDRVAVGVPPETRAAELRVDEQRPVVRVAAHDLDPPVLEADAERRGLGLVVVASPAVVPVDAGDGHGPLGAVVEAVDLDPVGVDALVVVDVHLAVQRAEEDGLAIWRPLNEG